MTIDVDTEGRPRTATNQLGQRYRFVYDDAGRVSEQVNPDGTILWFTFDRAGFVASIRTSHGDLQRFEYNGRGLPTKIVYADGSQETFDYDPMGRTIAATNRSVRLEWEYDAAGQVSVRRQGDFEFRSEVDKAQNQVAWVSSDDFRVGVVPGTRGELAAIDFGGRRISIAAERAPSLVTRVTLPNGIIERHEHDGWGRRRKDEVRTSDRLLVRRQVEYDPDGHVQSIDDSMRGGLRTCSYDDLGRLVDVQGARAERYAFDDASNIVSSHRFASARIETPDRLRHLDQRTYEYDASGRVRRIADGDRSWQLHYNVKGELASVELPDGGTVHYAYDPLGRRIEKLFDGGIRDGRHVRFVWQGGDVFKEEFLSGADLTRERFYLFTSNGPRARIEREPDGGETALYYHNDHVGTPHFCTDDEGNIVWTSEADSYGYEAVNPGDEDFQNIRLPGQYFDEETGLHYNRFRYYDPVSARYLQPDPIDTLVNPNRFNYPLDPLGAIDPLGLNLLVLNADPGDKTNHNQDVYGSAGQFTKLPKYQHYTGYMPPGGKPGDVGMLLDPNLGDLSGYDHIVIQAHGNPANIAVGKPGLWSKIRRKLPGGRYYSGAMSGSELAKLLKDKKFKGKVTIAACSTAGSNGNKPNFAQELADGLGAGSQVVAWDEAVIVDPNTGRASATWNMGKAVSSIDDEMAHDKRGDTWDTMPESWGRWTFEAGKPPVPG